MSFKNLQKSIFNMKNDAIAYKYTDVLYDLKDLLKFSLEKNILIVYFSSIYLL